MHGSQVYMARTKTEVSVDTMSDGSHWEFFAGYKTPGNTALWKDDVSDAAPLFTWENRTGVVTMTYMPAIKKYIMCVSTCTWANGTKSTVGPFDTYVPATPNRCIRGNLQFPREATRRLPYYLNLKSKSNEIFTEQVLS